MPSVALATFQALRMPPVARGHHTKQHRDRTFLLSQKVPSETAEPEGEKERREEPYLPLFNFRKGNVSSFTIWLAKSTG